MTDYLTNAQAIGIIIAGALTLMMYSFLYKDNIFYKFGEHLYVGISVGYLVNLEWWQVLYPQFVVPAYYEGDLILIIPTILGVLMLTRFIRQISWLSRTPLAFYIGVSAGLAIPAVLQANIIEQVYSTIMPLWSTNNEGLTPAWIAWNTFSIWVIFLGVLSVLFYFYFSIEHKGLVGRLGTVGIYFIMVSFGAAFGYTVMARVSLLIGRVQYLIDQVPAAFRALAGGGG
ncbi:MAG TPA: hypothetical protein VGB30_11835 [bacterium]|jgi:hypothetical protein